MSTTNQYQTLPKTENTSKPPQQAQNKYGLVVVFCAGEPYIDSETQEIYLPETEKKEGIDGEIYVGCRLRLEVASQLAEDTDTMILVGGSFDKVDAMYQYLVQHDVPPEKLYLLESHPSTMGNLWALRKLLDKTEKDPEPHRIHLLANAWQIHRIMAFAIDIIPHKYQLVPLVAEAFRLSPASDILTTTPYHNRIIKEYEGLADYYQGTYHNQDQAYEFWKSILHFQSKI